MHLFYRPLLYFKVLFFHFSRKNDVVFSNLKFSNNPGYKNYLKQSFCLTPCYTKTNSNKINQLYTITELPETAPDKYSDHAIERFGDGFEIG
jgi:hypothetical protein